MMDVIELKGTYREIGRGWGEVFQGRMTEVVQNELGVIAGFLGVGIDDVVKLGRRYMDLAQEYDPDFMQVLQGFSKGADIGFEPLFAIRTLLELLFRTRKPEGMCTSFAVTGAATASGETIVGQNIDWHPGLPLALLRITWPDGVRQLSLSMGGIWEYTLSHHAPASPFAVAATLTASWDDDVDSPTVPLSMVMHKASRRHSLEQALSEFTARHLTLGSFLLGNGDGGIVGVELGLREHETLTPRGGVLVHANHHVAERFKDKDIFLPFVPDSPLRHERLAQLIKKEHGSLTPERMMEFLSDHSHYPKGLCTHVDPQSCLPPAATVASIIMVPARLAIYIAVGNPCENEYVLHKL